MSKGLIMELEPDIIVSKVKWTVKTISNAKAVAKVNEI